MGGPGAPRAHRGEPDRQRDQAHAGRTPVGCARRNVPTAFSSSWRTPGPASPGICARWSSSRSGRATPPRTLPAPDRIVARRAVLSSERRPGMGRGPKRRRRVVPGAYPRGPAGSGEEAGRRRLPHPAQTRTFDSTVSSETRKQPIFVIERRLCRSARTDLSLSSRAATVGFWGLIRTPSLGSRPARSPPVALPPRATAPD
jgi:hypothetical protein